MAATERKRPEVRSRSIFDLPPDFFDSCVLIRPAEVLSSTGLRPSSPLRPASNDAFPVESENEVEGHEDGEEVTRLERVEMEAARRWTCNTCKVGFESLQDQRVHFKSDLHRLNVKFRIAGKDVIKEEDFDELVGDTSFEDVDISSISGSEDELERGLPGKTIDGVKQKVFLSLNSGDAISIWRCLLLDESVDHLLEHGKPREEVEVIGRLKSLVQEPRNGTHLRIALLASGGHFAGCVFDGNSVVAHKTFHRYVVRAKAGKRQSAKDATGKAAHSAGSSLRRYNEAALKKDILELLLTWKGFIESSLCIFIYAPSKNRQLLFDGLKPHLKSDESVIRHVPLTVHRPTLKEAKRVYSQLTQMIYANESVYLEDSCMGTDIDGNKVLQTNDAQFDVQLKITESSGPASGVECLDLVIPCDDKIQSSSPSESESTPLHVAASSGNSQLTMELLELGLNPCIKDGRGRTPYMLAREKEVRNTFRRFMALNLEKWDWHAAAVPSPLTKELEDAQAAKQAEKDAKRKAKAKELKKLRKAKEKAKVQAAQSENASKGAQQDQESVAATTHPKQQPHANGATIISKEEEERRALAEAREKRAAAAERRIAALNAQSLSTAPAPSRTTPQSLSDTICSCCGASLAGKVPFHRYHYKYCSTSCMHVHKQMLEDG